MDLRDIQRLHEQYSQPVLTIEMPAKVSAAAAPRALPSPSRAVSAANESWGRIGRRAQTIVLLLVGAGAAAAIGMGVASFKSRHNSPQLPQTELQESHLSPRLPTGDAVRTAVAEPHWSPTEPSAAEASASLAAQDVRVAAQGDGPASAPVGAPAKGDSLQQPQRAPALAPAKTSASTSATQPSRKAEPPAPQAAQKAVPLRQVEDIKLF